MTSASSDASGGRLVRPLPDLAKTLSVRRLAESLTENGHSPAAADAIAFAVCDPTAVRRQLTQPGEMRVADGYLQVIYTSVWTVGVLPYPNNPRTLPAFAYPVAAGSTRRRPLPREEDDPAGRPELVLSASRPDLLAALDAEMTYLMSHNPLSESVAEHGIREPVTLVPMVLDGVTSGSDGEPRATLAAVDGSSRTAAAFDLLGIDPMTAVTRLAGNGRGIRHAVSETLALAARDVGSLSDEDIARMRALVMPAMLVVGFMPDAGKPVSFRNAIESRLGSIHVEPPKVWSAASRLDVQVDAVLEALVEHDDIETDEAAWLAGNLTPDEAQEQGFTANEDRRAARLLEVFDEYSRDANTALRRLTTKRRVLRPERVAVAVEAAIRPYRSEISDQRGQSARSTLAAIWQMPLVASSAGAPAALKPMNSKTVVTGALEELDLLGVPGPMTRRLLIQAGYWLVRHNLIRKSTRGGDTDRRQITDVIGEMIGTEQGIRLLNRAIVDGRNGRTPRAVDDNGTMLEAADGSHLPATEAWIRETWPAPTDEDEDRDYDRNESPTPEAALARSRDELVRLVRAATSTVAALEEPTDSDNTPLIRRTGLPVAVTDDLLRDLLDLVGRVSRYRDIARDAADDTDDHAEDAE